MSTDFSRILEKLKMIAQAAGSEVDSGLACDPNEN